MSKYEIHRWDLIMTGNSTFKRPVIYIKPDIDFLEFARLNNFSIVAVVEGTGLQYDGNQVPATVNKGANFSDTNGYYVISLDSNSYGYPKDGMLGTVSFLGLVKAPVSDDVNVSNGQQSVSNKGESFPNKGESHNPVVDMNKKNFIVFLVLVVLMVLLYKLAETLCE